MKDKKRLEVKLSVRGDGSLSRNNLRSSNRSNHSNSSNNSSALPVSEIFATDRYYAPHNRSFDILDKYRRQPNQYGYPAQSLQALNHYEQPANNGYSNRARNNPYIDYTESAKPYRYQPQQLHNEGPYQRVYNDTSIRLHGSLPRSVSRTEQYRDSPMYNDQSTGRQHATLPRSGNYLDEPRGNLNYDNPQARSYGTLPRSVSRMDEQRNNFTYNDPTVRLHGSLPRSLSSQDQQRTSPIYPNSPHTLPAKYGPRRVRISELEPIVHGYGAYKCFFAIHVYVKRHPYFKSVYY